MIDTTEQAEAVAELYRDAELRILQRVTRLLATGIELPDWAAGRLARLQDVRAMILRELGDIDATAAARIADEIAEAYIEGGAAALADLKGIVGTAVPAVAAQQPAAVRQLASEIMGGVASTRASVLGFVDGAVREVVSRAIGSTLTRGQSRMAAAQDALDDLLGDGLDAIELPSGRMMNMTDYVTMSVRTGTANAQRIGHTDTLSANGLNLIVVQPGPRACPICDRWARSVLSLDGQTGRLSLPSLTGGEPVVVDVQATISQAISAGYEHPNCRCTRRAYLPGATDPSVLDRPPFDAEGYEAQQRQRQIERQIRNWKKREATSLDPRRAAQSRERVKAWQATMREHTAAHPYLKRQSRREQIGRVL